MFFLGTWKNQEIKTDPDAPQEIEDEYGLNSDLRISEVKWFTQDSFILLKISMKNSFKDYNLQIKMQN